MLRLGLWLFRMIRAAALRSSPVALPIRCSGCRCTFSRPRHTAVHSVLHRGFASVLAWLRQPSRRRPSVHSCAFTSGLLLYPASSSAGRRFALPSSQRSAFAPRVGLPARLPTQACLAFRPSGALPPFPRLTYYICIRRFNSLTFTLIYTLFVQSFNVLLLYYHFTVVNIYSIFGPFSAYLHIYSTFLPFTAILCAFPLRFALC